MITPQGTFLQAPEKNPGQQGKNPQQRDFSACIYMPLMPEQFDRIS
jgi:hypothetical protein